MKNKTLIAIGLLVLLVAGLTVTFAVVGLVSMMATKPVAVVLIYEIDHEFGAVPIGKQKTDELVSTLQCRLGRNGRVRLMNGGQIEVAMFTDDPETIARTKRLIARAGTIEFRILANSTDHATLIELAREEEGIVVRDAEGKEIGRWTPVAEGQAAGFEYPEIVRRSRKVAGKDVLEVLVVKDPFDVTGAYLQRARPGVDQTGRPCINFRLTAAGGRLFGGLTGSNLPDAVTGFARQLGIILDGKIYSAPFLQGRVSRSGQITGNFTKHEVEDLCDALSAGALPTPIRFVGRGLPDDGSAVPATGDQ